MRTRTNSVSLAIVTGDIRRLRILGRKGGKRTAEIKKQKELQRKLQKEQEARSLKRILDHAVIPSLGITKMQVQAGEIICPIPD